MSAEHLEARCVTSATIGDLIAELSASSSPDDFLAAVDALLDDPRRQLPLPTALGMPEALQINKAGGKDTMSAQQVHEYLGPMDRSNAADPRLWVWLAFKTYRTYMLERWPLIDTETDDPDEDQKKISWKDVVKNRWLMTNPSRRSIMRHGIARLWWIADITVDVDESNPITAGNPYGYTELALSSDDLVQNIFDRQISANSNVWRSTLDRIHMLNSTRDKNVSREEYRQLLRGMVAVDGYSDIGVLDKSKTDELAGRLLPN